MKKKFNVEVHYDVFINVEVEAEDREQAEELGIEMAETISLNEGEYEIKDVNAKEEEGE